MMNGFESDIDISDKLLHRPTGYSVVVDNSGMHCLTVSHPDISIHRNASFSMIPTLLALLRTLRLS